MNNSLKLLLVIGLIATTLVAPNSASAVVKKKAPAKPTVPAYDYQLITQSPYPASLPVGSLTNVWIEVKNTGTATWYNTGTNTVRLGSGSQYGTYSQQRDYSSEFSNDSWPSANRPAAMLDAVVPPGYHTRFQFYIKVPASQGEYKAFFTPVVDGLMWMKDMGIFWKIIATAPMQSPVATTPQPTVTPPTPAQPIQQPTQNINPLTVTKASRAVVKLTCSVNKRGGKMGGSGTLVKSGDSFIILSNLHVVETEDGSASWCLVELFKDPSNLLSVKFFRTLSYKYIDSETDLAMLTPIPFENANQPLYNGTIGDLEEASISSKAMPQCSIQLGESINILGYPTVGGELITVTRGIMSGFEFIGKNRYFKTDAVMDHGVSGGLAVSNTGCILGIPSAGRGKIGFILDLHYLVSQL
ncbi:MAG: serine protease [Patescibacteria group bacterium]